MSTKWVDYAVPLLQKVEGCKLEAYPDPATGGDPWTIGYGATGPAIHKGLVWTQQQAYNDLCDRVLLVGDEIDNHVRVPLTPHQKAALASFTYNVGNEAFETSTLLRLLNHEDYDGAARQFARWVHAGGKIMPGLIRRRALEKKMFCATGA